PESGKIDRMHDDSRAQELVCLATPNLPEFLTVNVLSPQNAKNLFYWTIVCIQPSATSSV
ncbi:hypothetical protein, partial [Aeromonas australiensis]|uniref:hypothetical protein n=1 Tax=Aeromonas australiensis TaxID=1114880 RepID=UPI001F19CA63